MTTVNPDELKALSETAMKAQKEHAERLEAHGKKLDAIDLDVIKKTAEDVTVGLEISQKNKLAIEAIEKGQHKLATDLETQLKDLKEKGIDTEVFETRFGKLEAVVERISLNPDAQDDKKSLEKAWKTAFNDFTRKRGSAPVLFEEHLATAEEFKALSVVSNPDGGYLVDPVQGAILQARVWETSPMRSICDSMEISSDAIEMPVDVDEAASGGWVGETDDRSANSNTPKIFLQRIPVYEQFANPMLTQKILDDASVDVQGWLQGKVADKFSRVENTAFVAGAPGAASPRGLLTYPNYTTPGVFQEQAIEQITSENAGVALHETLRFLASLKIHCT